MRIALVTENFLPKIDGITRTLGMVLTHLRAEGHRALVLGPTGTPWRYAGGRGAGCAAGALSASRATADRRGLS